MHVYLNYNLQSNACTIKLSFPNIQMFFLVHRVLGLLQLMRELKKKFHCISAVSFLFCGCAWANACMYVCACVYVCTFEKVQEIFYNNLEQQDNIVMYMVSWMRGRKLVWFRKGGDRKKRRHRSHKDLYIPVRPVYHTYLIKLLKDHSTTLPLRDSCVDRTRARACINEWTCMCVFTCACVSNDDWYYIKYNFFLNSKPHWLLNTDHYDCKLPSSL